MIESKDLCMDTKENTKISLFETFPREIGIWKKWCETEEEYKDYVVTCNGSTDCYCSVYRHTMRWNKKDFGDAMESGVILDKVYLDVDTKWGYEAMLVAHEYLDEHNIVHRINASGRWDKKKIIICRDNSGKSSFKMIDTNASIGFHIYYWITQDVENKKSALYNLHADMNRIISDKMYTGWGIETVPDQFVVIDGRNVRKDEYELEQNQIYSPVDEKVCGDVMRITRITNTWNPKRKRFCIPLSEKMLKTLGPEQICEISKKQQQLQQSECYMGQKLMKVPREFDVKRSTFFSDYTPVPDDNPNPKVLEGVKLPTCINRLLCDPRLDYDRRFWLLVYFRDRGITMEEAIEILSKTLDPEYAWHCINKEETPRRVYYGNQRRSHIKNCIKMSEIFNCASDCPTCHRYYKRHPIF